MKIKSGTKNNRRVRLTKRQKDALQRHKDTHGHTKSHINEMTKAMLSGKTFMEARRIAMKKKGK